MHKLIAIYATPPDPVAFDTHFADIHLPLVRAIPGLAKVVINRNLSPPWGGAPGAYQLVEMHFADQQSFELAMASPENTATGRDLRSFAKGLVTLHVVREIDNLG
jgi:uncharacterized protein (TIGR02118 family)